MVADHLAAQPEALAQPDGLREVARGDAHLGAALAQQRRSTGRSTSTCGLLVRSTQTRIAQGADDLVDLARW